MTFETIKKIMNHECEKFGELISGLVDGELTVQETEKVTLHLNRCGRCQKTKTEFEMVDRAIQSPKRAVQTQTTSLPSPLDIESRPATNVRKRRRFATGQLLMPLSITTAALLAVGISIFWPAEPAGAETTDVSVPSLELDKLKDLNRDSKKNTNSTLEMMELQLRIMRLNAKGLDPNDPGKAAIQSEIEKMLTTLTRLKAE